MKWKRTPFKGWKRYIDTWLVSVNKQNHRHGKAMETLLWLLKGE